MTGGAGIVALALLQTVVTFTTVARGSASDIDQLRQVVVRGADEWRALWKAHSSEPAPTVDFSQSMIVGIFLGTRPTSGYNVNITSVKSQAGKIVVEYTESRPAPGSMVAQVLTSPFHLVGIRATQADVDFRKGDP